MSRIDILGIQVYLPENKNKIILNQNIKKSKVKKLLNPQTKNKSRILFESIHFTFFLHDFLLYLYFRDCPS